MTGWLHPYLRQSAPQWRLEPLGLGPSTIGRAGCLLVSICQAARALASMPPGYSPVELNAAGCARGAFRGSNAIIPALAVCAGLQAPSSLRMGDEKGSKALTDCLLSTLDAGWLALLHVDHDRVRAAGDPEADHWILALAIQAGLVLCADPATGQTVKIDPVTLQGLARWGADARTYEVRAVAPIGPGIGAPSSPP